VFLLNGPRGTTNGTPGSHKIRYREVFRPIRNPKLEPVFQTEENSGSLKTLHVAYAHRVEWSALFAEANRLTAA